ncbi:hypothetical protein GN109_05750 [Collimonas pratensis]|uniref:hypothetical protein n=1 Tax=Collimonas pratensis TaxID=279113 RepID=UPI00143D200C|nr:hypothetical protein [Collimonas pratensis]NKI68918.1 hypothetical protein [Collimonas pratensis]
MSDILDSGMTQMAIADFCDCGQSTISDLSRGKAGAPSFDLGKKLMALHARARRSQKRKAAA